MATLTAKAKKEYIKSPNHCPYCKSDDIEAEPLDGDGLCAFSKVKCNDCGESWNDQYKLVGISEVEE